MPPIHNPTQDEILRLMKENNKMLHAMRRNAFLGGLVRILVWAAFVIIPAWLYLQYLAPIVQQLTTTVNQAQTTGAKAQVQMAEWQKTLLDLEAKIPGLSPKK